MWYPRVRRLTHVSKVRSSQVKCFVLVFVVVLVLDFVRAELWSDGVLEYRAVFICLFPRDGFGLLTADSQGGAEFQSSRTPILRHSALAFYRTIKSWGIAVSETGIEMRPSRLETFCDSLSEISV